MTIDPQETFKDGETVRKCEKCANLVSSFEKCECEKE
jgi:hypothetical protein